MNNAEGQLAQNERKEVWMVRVTSGVHSVPWTMDLTWHWNVL